MRFALAMIVCVAFIQCGVPVAAAAAPAFTDVPRAAHVPDGVRITFAVAAPTDVEVAVLGPDGTVRRHLAAGRLGPDAPPPLQADSLRQSLLWDGTDDAGRPVANPAACRVRVGLGLRGRLHRIIGWNPQHVETVRGITCGPDGTLYVLYGGGLYAHRTTTLIAAFDRAARYRRQIFPGPANLPEAKRAGWPHVRTDDGREVPAIGHLLTRAVYPGAVFSNRVEMAVTRDGRLLCLCGTAAGTNVTHADVRGGRRRLVLGTDGTVPADFVGPVVAPAEIGGTGRMALSPDERTVYVAGFFDPDRGREEGRGHCHVVWRMPLDGSADREVFLGKMYAAGAGADGLNDPQGLATDAGGNLYVADYGNDRVAVFSPAGALLDEIPVARPDTVRVSRRTGAVYVMTIEAHPKDIHHPHYYVAAHNWRPEAVLKFASRTARKPVWRFDVPRKPGTYGGGAYLALDEAADPPVLWVAGIRYHHAGWAKLLDRGDRAEDLGDVFAARLKDGPPPLGFIGDVTVAGGKVVTRHPAFGMHTNASLAYDAETGEPAGTYEPMRADGSRPENMWNLLYGEMTAGKDGNVYVLTAKSLRRYAPDGRALPFEATGTHVLTGFPYGHTRGAGLFVNRRGRMWVPAGEANRDIADVRVRVVSPAGRVEKESVLRVQDARVGGIAVDAAGHLYVGAQVARRGERLPEWVRGHLPPDGPEHHPSLDYKQCGALIRFPPAGGAVLRDPDGEYEAHLAWKQEGPVRLEDAAWLRRIGLHPVKHEMGCYCETTRFDVDAFGRLLVPDVFRFCVIVLDAAGNEVTRFGTYGNMDSRGPGSPVPAPALAFGWPLSVECARGRAYVADLVNRRVVAVDLAPAVRETCAID
ncbi:MAG: SMP-30/gluconolactonase/LRE family protein [Phycisphaerae bacterium]